MSRATLRIVVLVSALAWPFAVFAAVPPNVTGLSANFNDGRITVQWDTQDTLGERGTYRMYYSQKSILGNNGAYDDYVSTGGTNASFIFVTVPPYPRIFIAVAAVNGNGDESASFIEEVELVLTDGNAGGQIHEDQPPVKPTKPVLPSSGLPVVGIALMGGAMAGLRRMRRRA